MIRSVTVGLRASTSPLVRRAGPPTTTPAAAYSGIGARLKGMFGGSGSSEPAPEAADASAKPKSSLLDSLMNMGSGLTSGMGQIMSKSITPEMLRQQAQELTVPKYIEFMEKSQSGMASKVASFVNPAAAAAASSGELQKRQLAVLKYLTPDEADNIANLTRGQMEVIANRTGQGLVAVSEAIQAYSSIRMFIHFLAHCKEPGRHVPGLCGSH
ncbi:hypothetical protein H696_05454 [Fonticula alba]|uniref:Uncharacterized protein n=1 Tax=Fonticula alba TaxID=691883 RepID=A0A058Z260_FONAL|nr:hypothetical protein H696_05454 [Fonticula alba]KCV67988.1 hypothetical protein H696_05454 [Fonticula alba]|eukprot:XP_009497555.1 hypothetical protein H696_05454 [Fonticula alba]